MTIDPNTRRVVDREPYQRPDSVVAFSNATAARNPNNPNYVAGGGESMIADRTGLQDPFREALLSQINAKPLPERDPEGRINQSMGEIAQNEASAGAALLNQAGAAGFRGATTSSGLRGLYEGFGGVKADAAQGIRDDVMRQQAEDQRFEEQRQLQALGLAGQQINNQDALALDRERLEWQRHMAEQDAIRRRAEQAANQAMARQPSGNIRGLLAPAYGGGGGGQRGGRGSVSMGQPSVVGGGYLQEFGNRVASGQLPSEMPQYFQDRVRQGMGAKDYTNWTNRVNLGMTGVGTPDAVGPPQPQPAQGARKATRSNRRSNRGIKTRL